jgi:lipopolysaccharide transport system permease protein
MSADTRLVAALTAAPQSAAATVPEFVITGSPSLLESARELWKYRELVFFLAWRDITIRYRQTLLGAAWAVLQPLATMVVFSFLFGRVIKVPTNAMPIPLFYLGALLPWLYFSVTMTTAGNSLLTNSELLKKVYFPRIILPASGALIGLVDLAIGALILVSMAGYYGVASWRLLLWLPLTALLWLFAAGVAAFLSAVGARFRDVKHAIPFVVQIWFFLTPVIYPASAIPPRFAKLMLLNPLSGLVEAFRATTTATASLSWTNLGVSALLILITAAAGFAYFRRVEGRLTDIV